MKIIRLALLALLLPVGIAFSTAGAAHAQTSLSAEIHIGPSGRAAVDLGFFYDDLAPYGHWIQRPRYGWVWTPRSVAVDWQPYQEGHWVWTDQGWTWITDEPYGWATYHYGRWYDDPEIGWSWVPGNEWAPSWVSWQEGGDYIGWAPLPPSVTIGLGFDGLVSVTLAPAAYVFVPERYFLAPRLNSYFVPRDRVVNIYRETRNTSHYRYSGDRVFCQGVAVDRIQRAVGRPVTRYQLGDLRTRGGARIQGNQIQVFRPQVQRANVQPPSARPAARAAVVDAAQFRRQNPDRVARRAQAQGTAQQVQPGAQPKPAKPTKPAQGQRTEQGQRTREYQPRSPGQVQPEVTPSGRQRKTPQPPPAQTEQQRPAAKPKPNRPPATEQQQPPPPARERQQRVQPPPDRQPRPPQDNPPPQRQVKQQPPPERQQQPQNQRQQEQKQQQKQQQKERKAKDKEQPPPPPPPR